VRLSAEDLAVWDFLVKSAKQIDNVGFELHSMNGYDLRMEKRVRHWLEAVSTRSAKRRRKEILDQFILDLCRRYPRPSKEDTANEIEITKGETRRGTPRKTYSREEAREIRKKKE